MTTRLRRTRFRFTRSWEFTGFERNVGADGARQWIVVLRLSVARSRATSLFRATESSWSGTSSDTMTTGTARSAAADGGRRLTSYRRVPTKTLRCTATKSWLCLGG